MSVLLDLAADEFQIFVLDIFTDDLWIFGIRLCTSIPSTRVASRGGCMTLFFSSYIMGPIYTSIFMMLVLEKNVMVIAIGGPKGFHCSY
jgi:hypothetical protein